VEDVITGKQLPGRMSEIHFTMDATETRMFRLLP
jgi:hypothetical protein